MEDLLGWIEGGNGGASLVALSFTLGAGRDHYGHRCVFVVRSVDELTDSLRRRLRGEAVTHHLETDGEPARSSAPAIFKGLMRRMASELEMKIAEGDEAYRDHLLALADLYVKGCQLNWRELYGTEKPRRLAMPAYPFEACRFWVSDPIAGSRQSARQPASNGHGPVRDGAHDESRENGHANGNGKIRGNGADLDDELTIKMLEDVKAGRLDLDEAASSFELRNEG
jgi:acyl transferase domain-containing protein